MTQPLPPSSSRKRAHSEASVDGSISAKKKRKQIEGGVDDADNNANSMSGRDKKKRKKKKKRRASVTSLADGRVAVENLADPNVIVVAAVNGNGNGAPEARVESSHRIPLAIASSLRDYPSRVGASNAFKRGKLSAKAKGKQKATSPSPSPPPQISNGVDCGDDASQQAGSSNENSASSIIARLGRELEEKKKLLAAHTNTLNSLTNSLTCQICVDLMHRPFLLTPCGHLACYNCLVRWFTEPRENENGPAPPPPAVPDTAGDQRPASSSVTINEGGEGARLFDMLRSYRSSRTRKPKTCPHCRARIRTRPVEVYGVKSMSSIISGSGLVSGFSAPPAPGISTGQAEAGSPSTHTANGLNASTSSRPGRATQDPWAGIFPPEDRNRSFEDSVSAALTRGFPRFLPLDRLPGNTEHIEREGQPTPGGNEPVEETLETHGFHDREDGVYRCVACMHEIWDGVCSNDACGREYTGHAVRDDQVPFLPWLRERDDDDDSDEDEEEERIFDDMLRAQFPLEDDEDGSTAEAIMYADFTDDEDDIGPTGRPGPVRVDDPQYRAGFRAGRGEGYHEGYEEGFTEGLEEGRYQVDNANRRGRRSIPVGEGEDDDEEEEDSYEGSFIDDGDEDSDVEIVEDLTLDPVNDSDTQPVDNPRTRRRPGVIRLYSSDPEISETGENEDDDDGPPVVLPNSRGRNRRTVASDSDDDSE